MAGTATAQPKEGERPVSLAATHARLYHYTDAHAFRSIVRGNSLWGTYYEDLNDATEFRHMREPLAKVMADRFQPVIEMLAEANLGAKEAVRKEGGTRRAAQRAARIVGDNLYKVTFKQAEKEREQNSFVTSFCAHPEGKMVDAAPESPTRE
jgi:hypothetical protein